MDSKELRASLHAMADPGRFRILQYLAGYQATTVSELTRALRISQPLASWHLRILRKAGLITTHRYGRQVYCSLERARVEECRQALGELTNPLEGGTDWQ